MIFSFLYLTALLLPTFFPAGVGPKTFRPDWMNQLTISRQEQHDGIIATQNPEAKSTVPEEFHLGGNGNSVEAKFQDEPTLPLSKQSKLPSEPRKILNPNVSQKAGVKSIGNPPDQSQTTKDSSKNSLDATAPGSSGYKQKKQETDSKPEPAAQKKLTVTPKQETVPKKNESQKATASPKTNSNKTITTPARKIVSEIVDKAKSGELKEEKAREPELSSDLTKLKGRIETCLQYYYLKPVNADLLRPWSIMHGVLGYGQNAMVTSQGKKINAVDYLCHNGIGNDRRLFQLKNDKLSVAVGTGFQGHEGQLLAILAQVKTPIDHPIKVDGKDFTVRDLVEYEKLTCRAGTELTFKLIGLAAYLSTEEVWKDERGQGWDISRLLYEEMAQPVNGAACGGTHRLMGLSYALAVRRSRGEPINGQWKRAESFTESYHNKALTLLNPDGGFSTEFFEGVSHSPDPIRQIYSTGHLLEWLSFSMTRDQLRSPEITKMVNRLLDLMEAEYHPNQELTGTDVGPKGHALRALRLYELRLFDISTDVQKLADQDKRPLISATDVPAMQQKTRAVLPSSTESAIAIPTSDSTTVRGPERSTSQPNIRGRGIMRRR